MRRSPTGTQPSDVREFERFAPFATLGLALFAATRDGFRMTLAVINLFDRDGEESHKVIIPATINDALGRRLAVSVGRRR